LVPAIFGRWPAAVADAAMIGAGDRVLDVGCGTGVLAREIAGRVGPEGRVTGLDLNPGMLMVAERVYPGIDWQQGDAGELPFEDGEFDAVVSQFSLMYFPDRERALREMWRVLTPGGRLAVAVWAAFERSTGYVVLTEIAERRTNPRAAALLKAPFVLGDNASLLKLFAAAGVSDPSLKTHDGCVIFPSISEFLRIEVKGSPLDALLDEPSYQALLSDAEERLAVFCDDGGLVSFPMDAHIVTARKATMP
jgi:SAM-dependent methyltransferase